MTGLQILQRQRCVPAAIVQAFRGVPVANISDCMARMTAGGPTLRPMHKGGYLCGPALTVKSRPGDNLMIHKAIAMAQPGDVIVVDAGGDLSNALIGELMVTTARKNGIAGFVMNGAIRDLDMIAAGDFPVYAAGVTHRGPYKDGPGEINVTIAIAGMVIQPGDLVLGDADGLLCVPIDSAAEILKAAQAKGVAEQKILKDIAEGTLDISWIDATLKRIGCNTEPR
ncbi:MAG: regulator of ribonuclease A-like protein [Ramlibacter sp.]|jgi:RraA family protein|nr:regulator of ribonuclease A-like protein [Ramlibacter sp.]MDB5911557.1 regulator of ribonuclease A-like protein [Ramlibacter sp.]